MVLYSPFYYVNPFTKHRPRAQSCKVYRAVSVMPPAACRCGGTKKAPPQIAGAKLSFAVPPCFSAEHAPRPCLPCIGSARQDFIARMAMRSPAYSGGRSGLRGLRAFQPGARSLESCGQIAFSVGVRLLLYPFDAGCASPIWAEFLEKGAGSAGGFYSPVFPAFSSSLSEKRLRP